MLYNPSMASLRLAIGTSLLLLISDTTFASTFSVKPVQVILTASGSSALLTVSNDSTEPIRLQVRAFAWDQSSTGEMLLSPTGDIIFFPTLLVIEPHQQRNVRVGTKVAPGASERSYRLFITELPPADGATTGRGRSELRILTELGIPVFVREGAPSFEARVEDIRLLASRAALTIRNMGGTHFMVQAVRVVAVDAAGAVVLQRSIDGWYVLPGGIRRFTFEIQAGQCSKIHGLNIEIETDVKTINEHWAAPPGSCGP